MRIKSCITASFTALLFLIIGSLSTYFSDNSSLSYHEREFARNYLKRMLLEYELLATQLSKEQITFQLDSNSWSILQNIEHVIAAEKLVIGIINEELDEGPKDFRTNTPDSDIIEKLAVRTESSQKFTAPPKLRPTNSPKNAQTLIKELKNARQQVISFLDKDLDLRRYHRSNPLFKEIDLYQWILFVGAHSERHLLQCRDIMSDIQFPAHRGFSYRMDIQRPADEVFKALTTDIDKWWITSINDATAESDTLYVNFKDTKKTFIVEELETNKKVVWKCVDIYLDIKEIEDKTEWVDTRIIWTLEEGVNEGITSLSLTHEGLVPELECYEICAPTWEQFLEFSLKRYLNEGEGRPLSN